MSTRSVAVGNKDCPMSESDRPEKQRLVHAYDGDEIWLNYYKCDTLKTYDKTKYRGKEIDEIEFGS